MLIRQPQSQIIYKSTQFTVLDDRGLLQKISEISKRLADQSWIHWVLYTKTNRSVLSLWIFKLDDTINVQEIIVRHQQSTESQENYDGSEVVSKLHQVAFFIWNDKIESQG